MIVEATGYLSPATVLAPGESGYVQVAIGKDEVVWARMAMAVPYVPEAGDEVLVIGSQSAEAYVIGVLAGHGTTVLRVPCDLRFEAPHGSVQIDAGKSIQMRSKLSMDLNAPRATFRFERMNVLVTTLVQRVADAFTWATGLIQSKSGRMRWIAAAGWLVRAGRAHLKTEANVHINGKTIHLG